MDTCTKIHGVRFKLHLVMKFIFIVIFLHLNLCTEVVGITLNSSCGLDGSPVEMVYEGVAAIENYPWMGMLYYPMEISKKKRRFTISVVLVTRQVVIAAATEIDKLPKSDFRAKARVVLGHACGVVSEIKVRDYTFHPEYVKDSFSALAMLQLETDHVKTELRHICQPPAHFIDPSFFALTLTDNCMNPKVRIHKMKYVNINECRKFYRRAGLGQSSLWPRHAACARTVSRGKCVWRSGSVLAVKQDGRWRLLGFSVYGPGCGDPARFLDYGMYHQWVQLSSSTVGQPAITRMGDNHLILRRSLGHIQRYGPCDPEETVYGLYSDSVTILYKPGSYHAKYNVSLYASVEYSCVTFKARPYTVNEYKAIEVSPQPDSKYSSVVRRVLPKIRLRRWCATSSGICKGYQHIEIHFFVDINFSQSVIFTIEAFGKEARAISAVAIMKSVNVNTGKPPPVESYLNVLKIVTKQQFNSSFKWFYRWQVFPTTPAPFKGGGGKGGRR